MFKKSSMKILTGLIIMLFANTKNFAQIFIDKATIEYEVIPM